MAVLERRQIGESARDFSARREPGRLLSPRQREVLRHIAMGENYKEIGLELHISRHTVKSHISNRIDYGNSEDGILWRLGAVDGLNAVLTAIASDEINLWDITADYDLSKLEMLSPREIEVLLARGRDKGRSSTDKQIAHKLDISYQTVKNHQTNINSKLDLYGEGSKIRAVVLFLAWSEKRRQEKGQMNSGA